jgi:malonate decarboxylase gamma subunit
MGGVRAIWEGDLAGQVKQALEAALADLAPVDERAALGLARGGRKFAQPVIEAIVAGRDVLAS